MVDFDPSLNHFDLLTLYGAGDCKNSCEDPYECGNNKIWKQTSIEVYVLNGIRVEDALCTHTQRNNWDIDYGSCGYRIRNYQTVTSLSGGTKESILCCIE